MEFVSMSNLTFKLIDMKTISFLLFTSAFFIFSCNRPGSLFSKDKNSVSQNKQDQLLAPLAEDKATAIDGIYQNQQTDSSGGILLQGSAPGQNPDWDKKIIKTASLKLEVKDFNKYNEAIHNTAKRYGTYIAGEEQNLSDEKKETTISIKVPVEQFDAMINQLPSDSDKIIEKKITTEDVTGEVVDTKSRLQAKEQMRLKYLEFLKQSKNMEDVLKVQSEINNIQEEMESASGRINYLSHQSAYSTINLTFFQPLTGYDPVNDSPEFFTRTLNAFKTGFDSIADIFIGLVSIWPVCLLVFFVWIIWKRNFPKVNAAKEKL
jgi:hypothetical protein